MRPSVARPIAVTAVAVTLVVCILLGSGLFVRALVANAFMNAETVRATRALVADLLQAQLDEKTGIRGYAATKEAQFLEPYYAARLEMADRFARLAPAVRHLGVEGAPRALQAAAAVNAQWTSVVADPLLHPRPRHPTRLQIRGKQLVDRFRGDVRIIDNALRLRERQLDQNARVAIDRIGLFIAIAVLLLLFAAAWFIRQQLELAQGLERERLQREEDHRHTAELAAELATEKRIADTLQDAIAQRPLPLHPTLRFSATYVPATEETKVGGDWYDALELPGSRVLFAIGDVAGHGIDAAVAMSRSRQALIVSALLDSDPASVLARVNTELIRQAAPMVTAVAGFADARTYEFVYATAGHPPPVLVEPNRPPRLLDFGGVPLGVMKDAKYRTHRIQSVPGAMLVLYTDGAVEHSRDVLEGEEILLAAVTQAAQRPDSDCATIIHDGIFNGRSIGDDVAILTVGFATGSAATLNISADNAQSAFTGRIVGEGGVAIIPLADAIFRREQRRRRLQRNAS